MECENCGQSLAGEALTLPWEDGDNPNAYVTCRYCGHENNLYCYDEDDDNNSFQTGRPGAAKHRAS